MMVMQIMEGPTDTLVAQSLYSLDTLIPIETHAFKQLRSTLGSRVKEVPFQRRRGDEIALQDQPIMTIGFVLRLCRGQGPVVLHLALQFEILTLGPVDCPAGKPLIMLDQMSRALKTGIFQGRKVSVQSDKAVRLMGSEAWVAASHMSSTSKAPSFYLKRGNMGRGQPRPIPSRIRGRYRLPRRTGPAHKGNLVPSNSGRNTLSRQWELLRMLPTSGSGATAKSLQERLAEAGYPTTKRTVERDLEDLSTVFAIRKNDKSVPYGFSWTPPSGSQVAAISVIDALTLTLVKETLRPLIPAFMLGALEPRFEQANSKLTALGGNSPASSWRHKVASVPAYMPLVAPTIDAASLACVQQALIDDQRLACTYYSLHRHQTSELVLNPLGLVQRGDITYLIATAEPYDDVRQLALHRLTNVAAIQQSAKAPDGFDLKTYTTSGAMQFGDNASQMITLQAWVSTGLLRMLRETPLTADMEIMSCEDGAWIRAVVADTWELEWWLLSHTGSICVESPPSLRERLKERLRRGLELYEDE